MQNQNGVGSGANQMTLRSEFVMVVGERVTLLVGEDEIKGELENKTI